MAYYRLSATAESFVRMVYEQGWILRGFDWPSWKGSDEAVNLRDDPDMLNSATHEQIAKLLTVLIRQERFCDGSLAAAYETGLLTAIVRRAAQLASIVEREET